MRFVLRNNYLFLVSDTEPETVNEETIITIPGNKKFSPILTGGCTMQEIIHPRSSKMCSQLKELADCIISSVPRSNDYDLSWLQDREYKSLAFEAALRSCIYSLFSSVGCISLHNKRVQRIFDLFNVEYHYEGLCENCHIKRRPTVKRNLILTGSPFLSVPAAPFVSANNELCHIYRYKSIDGRDIEFVSPTGSHFIAYNCEIALKVDNAGNMIRVVSWDKAKKIEKSSIG